MKQLLVSAKGLVKRYGSRAVVNDIHLEVNHGEILALIGPNGAGKSTTVELLVGLRLPNSGEVTYWHKNYQKHIGVQLQSPPFFPGLNSLENLRFFAALYKKNLTRHEGESILQVCGLSEVMHTDASRLSGGQQKRLAIAISMVHRPELLFLDEPTAALDPRSRLEIHSLIRKLAEQGVSIVLTSHDMDEVSKLSDRVAMINAGRIVAQGQPSEVCATYQVESLEDVYLHLTNKEEVTC
ncbi:ABC transporter ATP-binding protein [Bacillus horti]|uniref:ABC-2 type transport system ATP-binding protein n=1 Tax=Caldalkalibacillus horti TaxID=77523 RepID=A0ABT9W4U4_9BACI|nr:ABC transporter ATP-binding protein [Bacillus horti]MDQ0168276.1 ABC-2 type transport system ATP-binding protein [Bacillus horti]